MRDRPRRADHSVSAILFAVLGAVATQSVMAAIDLSAGISVGGQYDTNARQLASFEASPPTADGRSGRDDVSTYLGANVAATIGDRGPLQARFQATYGHSESAQQETLSYDDYSFATSVDWRPGRVFDVSLQASQNRLPLGLADIGGLDSAPQTTQSVRGALRLRPTPRWQLSLKPGWTDSKTRLADGEDFRLRETSADVSIEFIGAGRLVPGVGITRSTGRFSGVENATRYKQLGVYGSLNYSLTEVTTFALSAGQTQRTTRLREPSSDPAALANEGKDPAFTGTLSLYRRLTPKTSVNLGVFRNFQLYNAGVNTTIGNGYNAGINWAATRKISASLTATHAWSSIQNIPAAGQRVERLDLLRSYALGASYRASRLITVNATVTRNIRNSEVGSDQYNSTTAGLSISIGFD